MPAPVLTPPVSIPQQPAPPCASWAPGPPRSACSSGWRPTRPSSPPAARLTVHLVDPHPPGGGRVWRAEQPDLLWANSLVGDVTVLPDASVVVDGPVSAGPTLWQWVQQVAPALPADSPVGREARRLGPASFPSRPLVNAYLRWALDRVVADVVPVGRRAPAPHPGGRRAGGLRRRARCTWQTAPRSTSTPSCSRRVTWTPRPTPAERATAARAARHGLTYLPTAYTADVDLSVLAPGEDVLVRGAGLAFVDLAVLLTSGRGGAFERTDGGRLRYVPSGREPVLHVGSRRGVPYRPKIGYPWAGPPVPLRFFTPAAVDAAFGAGRPLDLRADLAPLIARELGWAHYTELFRAFPERTALPWAEFAERVRRGRGPAEPCAPWSPRRCPTRPTGSTSPRSTGRSPGAASTTRGSSRSGCAGTSAHSLDRAADPAAQRRLGRLHRPAPVPRHDRRARHRAPADPPLGERGPRRLVDEPVQLPGQRPARPAAGGAAGAVGGRGRPLPRRRRRRGPRRGGRRLPGRARPACPASPRRGRWWRRGSRRPTSAPRPDPLVTGLLACAARPAERVLPDPDRRRRRAGDRDGWTSTRRCGWSPPPGHVHPRLFAVGLLDRRGPGGGVRPAAHERPVLPAERRAGPRAVDRPSSAAGTAAVAVAGAA